MLRICTSGRNWIISFMLLSMPIPSAKILTARLFGVFAMGLLYELIVMIPTLIVYFLNTRLSVLAVVFRC